MKRLPKKAEFKALLKLPHKWDEKRNVIIFTASNGNELFLPAYGYRYGTDVYDVGNYGSYWSDTPYNNENAWYLYFTSDEAEINNHIHKCGRTVHLVSDDPCDGFIDMGTGIYWAIENYQKGEKIYFTWDEAMAIKDKVNDNAPEEYLLTIPESSTIDWKQRRYEIAKAAMHGILTMPIDPKYDSNISFEEIAHRSVAIADELIKQLKQTQL